MKRYGTDRCALPCLALALCGGPALALPGPDSAAEPVAALNPIIVTARRREETVQRTPVSVVALTAKDLEARTVTNLRTLQNFVPNLTFATSQNVGEASGNIFIRGIGQEDFAASAEPGVGFYVDGVYLARTSGTIMNLLDVERVEVLRGPQGTLFGKNTIGGAINIMTAVPNKTPLTRIALILGNQAHGEARATVNQPLSDAFFLRLSLSGVRRGGYLRRLDPPADIDALELVNKRPINLASEGSERSEGARLQLRWRASNSITADLAIDGSRRSGSQGALHIDAIDPRFGALPQINQLIAQGKLPGPAITDALVRDNMLESYAGGANFLRNNNWGVSVTLSKQLGPAELRFITARRALRSDVETDSDGLYFALTDQRIWVRQKQFSGEFQLIGTAGPLAYTIGLFAFGERIRLLPVPSVMNAILFTCACFYPPGTRPRSTIDRRQLTSDSRAAYAQVTYKLADWLSGTLGARYSSDHKSIVGRAYQLDANLQPTSLLLAQGSNFGVWKSVTYRAGVEFQATSDLMAYVSLAKGFKGGGFNARTALSLPNLGYAAYRPETARTVEAGLRSEWFARRLRFNATVFETQYDQMQVRVQSFTASLLTTLVENAGKARIRGVELELAATPAKGLNIAAAYGHLDPKYLEIGRVEGLTLGNHFQRTPSDSLSLSVDYRRPVKIGTIGLHGDYSYRSREQFQIAPAINDQPGYALIGARVDWKSRDGQLSLALFGTNLTDKRYRTAGRGTQIQQTGFIFSSVGLPRQVGLEASIRF